MDADLPSKPPEKLSIVKCTDCKRVLGVGRGQKPEEELTWSVCIRCVAKRNGIFGARNTGELGIY